MPFIEGSKTTFAFHPNTMMRAFGSCCGKKSLSHILLSRDVQVFMAWSRVLVGSKPWIATMLWE
jgi:hypothetical protein